MMGSPFAADPVRLARYAPPTICYPVRRNPWVLYGLCLQAVAVLGIWCVWLWHMRTVWEAAQLALACLMPVWVGIVWWLAVRGWRKTPQGMLQWQALQWQFLPAVANARPVHLSNMRVAWDLQTVLLLRAHGRPVWRGTVWFWLVRRDDPLAWQALRRAVYSG